MENIANIKTTGDYPMLDQKPLLSICIPTYNRSFYLDRLLSSILRQVSPLEGQVEIVISDNASTDNTEEYCSQIVEKNDCVFYSKNSKNEGWERNYSNLYFKARGRFVWLIGDDDYLADGALTNIIDMLNEHANVDAVYINSQAHKEGVIINDEKIKYQTFNNNEEFVSKVGVFFTFISGVIINKEKHLVDISLVDSYMNTDLNLLAWVFTAVANGKFFIYVDNKYVIVQVDNTGGYKLFTVFAANLTRITNDFFPIGTKNNYLIRKSAMKFLLNYVGRDNKKFESENYMIVTDKSFGDLSEYKYFYRYLYCNPKLSAFFIRCLNLLRKIKSSI